MAIRSPADPRSVRSLGLCAFLFAVVIIAVGAAPASATLPGTNGKIVYNAKGVSGPTNGFTIDPDGSDKHQIGPRGNTTCVNWSPDGTKVLCNLWREADGDRLVDPQPATANPDGSGFTLLNPNLPLDLFCLSWSPEGARLLCHSEGMANPADAGLYTVRSSDAGDLVRVAATPPNGFDNGYGYSPDGSRVLFARYDSDDNGTLFSVRPDGSGALQLSPPGLSVIDLGFFDRVGADWSPTGSQVTFAGFQRTASGEFTIALFVVNADGTGLRQITPSGLGAISAQWSPNDEWIAFTAVRRVPEVWIVHPDGTGVRKIALPLLDRLDRRAFKNLKRKFLKQCKKKSSNTKQCKRKAKRKAKTKAASQRLTPVWSPDSTKLLFQRLPRPGGRHGKVELWTVSADGSGLSKLTRTRSLAQYAWGTAPPGGL
jgi:Tol biopolymer transport system component